MVMKIANADDEEESNIYWGSNPVCGSSMGLKLEVLSVIFMLLFKFIYCDTFKFNHVLLYFIYDPKPFVLISCRVVVYLPTFPLLFVQLRRYSAQ